MSAAILEDLACGRPGCLCAAAIRHGRGATHCPAHEDRTPSLGVSMKDGTVLVHCRAGCSQDDVIDALRQLGLWTTNKPAVREPSLSERYDARYPTRPDPILDPFLRSLRAFWWLAVEGRNTAHPHYGPVCSCWPYHFPTAEEIVADDAHVFAGLREQS